MKQAQTCEIIMIMRSLAVKLVVLGLIGGSFWLSRTVSAGAQPLQTAPELLPDPANAVSTFFAARAWLNAGGTGPVVATPADVHSVAVVLRLRGRMVGMGKDAGDSDKRGSVDRALRSALTDARTRRTSQPATTGEIDSIGTLVTLELELAGAREPLIGRTFEEVARSIEPGECGLQLTDASRTAYEPASHLLARRMASPVSRAVLAMVTELGLPPRDLPELQALGGNTAMYASHSIRLAQVEPTSNPFTLARVLPAVSTSPASRADAAVTCAKIIARLAAQLEVAPTTDGLPADAGTQIARTGLRGDYVIAADRYEPFAAGATEQALCAWALARAAATAGFPESLRNQARITALGVLHALADRDNSESDPTSEPAAVAYAILAMAELASTGQQPQQDAAFKASLSGALGRLLAPATLATLRPHVQAAALDAAATLQATGTPVIPAKELMAALNEAWKSIEPAELPIVAPLLIDAEQRFMPTAIEQRLATHRGALDAARTVLIGTQIRAEQTDRSSALLDMPGAYPIAGSSAGRISAQSTRPHVFMAMIAGMPATRSAMRDEQDRNTVALAIRFVQQLQASPVIAYCSPAPERAQGGVLASPADASQPAAAQAFAILALTESERAFERLAQPTDQEAPRNP